MTHPNVCRVFESLSPSRRGRHVGDVRDDGLTPRESWRIACSAPVVPRRTNWSRSSHKWLQGLQPPHEAGIVHRDSSPVMSCSSHRRELEGGRAVVTDFGLAHTSAPDATARLALTGTGDIVAHPHTLRQRCCTTARQRRQTDIYALGVVMYEMVTGRLPFTGETPLGVCSIGFGSLPNPRAPSSGSGPEVGSSHLARVWNVEPSDRFSRVADVIAAFGAQNFTPVPSMRRRRTRHFAIGAVCYLDDNKPRRAGDMGEGGRPTRQSLPRRVAAPLKVRRSVPSRLQESLPTVRERVVVGSVLGHADDGVGRRREAAPPSPVSKSFG